MGELAPHPASTRQSLPRQDVHVGPPPAPEPPQTSMSVSGGTKQGRRRRWSSCVTAPNVPCSIVWRRGVTVACSPRDGAGCGEGRPSPSPGADDPVSGVRRKRSSRRRWCWRLAPDHTSHRCAALWRLDSRPRRSQSSCSSPHHSRTVSPSSPPADAAADESRPRRATAPRRAFECGWVWPSFFRLSWRASEPRSSSLPRLAARVSGPLSSCRVWSASGASSSAMRSQCARSKPPSLQATPPPS